MLGTLFRVLILRLLGARAAAVLAIIAVVLGWRGRRSERRLNQPANGRATGQNERPTRQPPMTEPTGENPPPD
jgi:hypothetical protein